MYFAKRLQKNCKKYFWPPWVPIIYQNHTSESWNFPKISSALLSRAQNVYFAKRCENIAKNIFGHLGFQSAMKTGPLRVGIFQKSLKPARSCILWFERLRRTASLHSVAWSIHVYKKVTFRQFPGIFVIILVTFISTTFFVSLIMCCFARWLVEYW